MPAVTSSVIRLGTDGDIESTWHCVDVVAREKACPSSLEVMMAVTL